MASAETPSDPSSPWHISESRCTVGAGTLLLLTDIHRPPTNLLPTLYRTTLRPPPYPLYILTPPTPTPPVGAPSLPSTVIQAGPCSRMNQSVDMQTVNSTLGITGLGYKLSTCLINKGILVREFPDTLARMVGILLN